MDVFSVLVVCDIERAVRRELDHRELEQMDPKLNFQVPAEGLELVILLPTVFP